MRRRLLLLWPASVDLLLLLLLLLHWIDGRIVLRRHSALSLRRNHVRTGRLSGQARRLGWRIGFAVDDDCAQLRNDLLQFLHLVQLHLDAHGYFGIRNVGALAFDLLQVARQRFFAEQHGVVAAFVEGVLHEVDAVIGVAGEQLQRVLFLVEYFQLAVAYLKMRVLERKR